MNSRIYELRFGIFSVYWTYYISGKKCSADPLCSAFGGGLRRELSRTINHPRYSSDSFGLGCIFKIIGTV